MAMQGYLSGYGDNIYAPDDNIQFTHAIKVLVMATSRHIGLPEDADLSAYLSTASSADYLDGVENSDGLINVGNLYLLLCNILDSKAMFVEMDGMGISGYHEGKNTVLYEKYNISSDVGILVANDLTALWGVPDISANQVVVRTNNGDLVMNVSETSDIRNQLGKKIKVYYEDIKGDRIEMRHYEVSDKNEILTLKLSDIDYSFSDWAS